MKGTVIFDFDDTLVDTVRFKEALAEAPEEAMRRMSEFVFEGADELLCRLKKEGWTLALLTRGEPAWQERKAVSSGLARLFDHRVYTSEPKVERVPEIRTWPTPLVFVNDNGEEIDAMRAVMPEGHMIGVLGPKAEPRLADAVCADIRDVYGLVISR